jgi:prepilin-type N-terminal cleavage/methylation domain-containing protein
MQSSGPLPLIKKILKKKEEGFSLIELVVVVAVLSALSAIAIPQFNCFQRKAKASTALAAMRQIQTECAVQKASTGSSGTYSTGNLNSYQILSNGSNSCSGAQSTGVISATPNNTSQLPTFLLATNSNELTYNFRGHTGTNFTDCLGVICGDASDLNIGINAFENRFNQAVSDGITLENNYYRRGDSIYVIVEGDTWEKALENANKLGGTLATINDQAENEWLVDQLYGDSKASSKLSDQLGLPGEELRGTSIWLGHTNQNNSGSYESVSGDENIFNNWGPGELADGLGKQEKYTMMTLYDNYARDPGMVGTVSNRQFNTQELIERGGAHIFYGLAEIKLNEINDVNDNVLD